MKVSAELSEDLVSIVSKIDQCKMSPFMKLFWGEQQKYLKSSSKVIRYHPVTIRYCPSLASKSADAYDEIWYDANKGTGFVILPSRRRLHDYKNYIKPQRGFNQEIIQELLFKNKIFRRTGTICSHTDGRNQNPRKLSMGQTHSRTYWMC